MESEELFKKFTPILKRNSLPISLGLAGMIFFAYGLIALFGTSSSSSDISFNQSNPAESKPSASKITIDIEGAVVKPGVYSLNADSRIQDVLVASLGLSQEADRDWVAKNLNLAAKLTDGAKIYIPKAGESLGSKSVANGTNSVGIASQDGQVNINSASLSELDTLSGVGPVTAQKIISNRPYSTVDDLVNKKAVSSKVFEQIKDRITVY